MKRNSYLAIAASLQPNSLYLLVGKSRVPRSGLKGPTTSSIGTIDTIEADPVPKAKVQGYQSGFEGPPEAPRPSEVGEVVR